MPKDPTQLDNATPLTIEQWQALDAIRQAEKARRSFREFLKQSWPILEPQTEYKESILTAAIADHLQAVHEKQISRLLISAPPQFGKSIVSSIAFPMWTWINRPSERFLCVSFKNSLAEYFSEQSLKIFKSDWYQQNYALPKNITLEKETIEFFANTATGSRRMSAFDSATGFGVAGGVLLVDDPHPVAVSDDVRISQVEFFNKGLSNRPGANGSCVVLGQRVHTEDLIGTLIQMGGWEHLNLPNEYNPKRSTVTVLGWADPRKQENELLWPEVFTEEKTKLAKRYGRQNYEGQYNQAPVKKQGNIFNPEHFRTYTTDTLPERFDETVISLDCTFANTKASDYVVLQCWSRLGANYYLRDQMREQADFTRTLQMFISFCNTHEAHLKLIEQSANGFAIISSLKNRISGIIPVKPGSDTKLSRWQAVAPLVEAGNVYIALHSDYKEDFLLELASVPSSRHDDMADCMAQALNRLQNNQAQQMVWGKHILW